jgi:hypothetical protein
LYNLTNMPVTLDGQELTIAAQPSGCTDPLPTPVADHYFLVPACLAQAAHARRDIVWSASIPNCSQCMPVARKRNWFSNQAKRPTTPTALRVIEHYTDQEGRQGVGAEFFRQRYL